MELPVIVFPVIELDDLFAAAVVITEEDLVAHRVAGQIGFVNRIFDIVVFWGYPVFIPKDSIVSFIQQDDRAELLGIAYQHQTVSSQDGYQRHCRVALAGFIYNDHVKVGLGLADTMC